MHKKVVAQILKATRKKYSAEEKIRIVLEGLRVEIPISELCRREGIAPTMYYRWSKAFFDLEILAIFDKFDAFREIFDDSKDGEVRRM